MACGLHQMGSAFRKTLNRCICLVKSWDPSLDIVAELEKEDAESAMYSTSLPMVLIPALHISLVDMWRSKGVIPSGKVEWEFRSWWGSGEHFDIWGYHESASPLADVSSWTWPPGGSSRELMHASDLDERCLSVLCWKVMLSKSIMPTEEKAPHANVNWDISWWQKK